MGIFTPTRISYASNLIISTKSALSKNQGEKQAQINEYNYGKMSGYINIPSCIK